MQRLAATDRVRVLDLKAYYRGTSVDLAPDPDQYRLVVGAFRKWCSRTHGSRTGGEALAVAEDRLSSTRPSTRGRCRQASGRATLAQHQAVALRDVSGLLECIEQCEARGIRMYGGGQFEPVRAPPDPAARVHVLPRWAERCRAVRVQRGAGASGVATEPAAAAQGHGLLKSQGSHGPGMLSRDGLVLER